MNKFNSSFQYSDFNPVNYDSDTYNPIVLEVHPDDLVFIVFDRDKDGTPGRSDEDYLRIKKRCDDLNYEILLTSPMFEMWLLFHHKDVDYSDYYEADLSTYVRQKLAYDLEFKEGRTKLTYYEWIDRGGNVKKMKKLDAQRYNNFYKDSFPDALSESLKRKIDFESLLDFPGSNVGIVLQRLVNESK